MTLGTALIASRKLKARLGPPDLYPQDPNQKEDDLNAVHVKQGFTTSYLNLVANDEYGSALSKIANFNASKIWNDFKSIQVKKEEFNTIQESKDKNKKQPINTRDDFWLVTGRNKPAVEKWFKDLAGSKPYSVLAKKVPIFNRREEILMTLSEYEVPISRGVWLIKMTAAYAAAMQEANKSKKRVQQDPSVEWTGLLVKYLAEQRTALQEHITNPSGVSSLNPGANPALASLEPEVKPENTMAYKQLMYGLELCWYMYQQGLLDRTEFLQWILDIVEKSRNPEEVTFRHMMPTLLRYGAEFAKSEMLSRKLAHQCAKKITLMVQETEAFTAGSSSSSNAPSENPSAGQTSATSSTVTTPTKSATVPGTNQQLPPVIAGLLELQNDPYSRIIIFGLSSLVQTIVLECPSALVWNYFGENKTPSSLLGSPLDHLPNLSPSSLPMPPRANNPAIRQHIRQCEGYVKERSAAAEMHWATNGADTSTNSTSAVVGKILSVLEELDRFVFDKNDSSNCMDVLYNRIWSPNQPEPGSFQSGPGIQPDDEAVVTILCEWAVTNKRGGEHRAFVAAKLLEQRQIDMLVGDDGDGEKETELYMTGPPVFQELLFKYLDSDAPFLKSSIPPSGKKGELANLVLLFHELLAHDVFSHDSYMNTLISRGDLTSPLQEKTGGKDDKGQSDASFEDSKINDDLGALVKQITEGNKLDDPYSPDPQAANSTNSSQSNLPEVWRYNRHWQYTHHLPIPGPSDESSAHDINQRHILLYGCGKGKDEGSKQVKKLTKEIGKLFGKRFSIDVNDGGKIKKHTKHEFMFGEVILKFQELSYFDQHLVTFQCGQTVLEMIQAFHSCSAAHLPVQEHVSFLFDLTGLALNIQCLLDWCIQLLKDLPLVESQLIERSSVLTRNYTTGLALFVVGVLRRYHSVLILTEQDVRSVWDSLVKISHRHSHVPGDSPRHDSSSQRRPSSNLDCNSAEWCILGYLYDLATSCPSLKTSDKYGQLRRLFNQQLDVAYSNFGLSDQFVEMLNPYITQPKKKIDPLLVKLMHDKPEHQYSLVVTVLAAVINGQLDTDKLNDLAILCCELTAQCGSLAQEWLGALYTLCCFTETSYGDLKAQVNLTDTTFYGPLGIFVSILIARHAFPLQAFVVHVVTRSLIKNWNESNDNSNREAEAEAGARLSLHLLLKLFKSVEAFQPLYYTVASPRPIPVSIHATGIKLSCDRHLLAATHANISSGINVGSIIAVLKALLCLTLTSSGDLPMSHILGTGGERSSSIDDDFGLGTRGGSSGKTLGELANLTLRQICSQEWVRDRCLQSPDYMCQPGILMDRILKPHEAQALLRMICHTEKVDLSKSKMQESNNIVGRIIQDLDEWSLRSSMVDIKLMYHRLGDDKDAPSSAISKWLEKVARCIIDSFQLGENDGSSTAAADKDDSNDDSDVEDGPAPKKAKMDNRSLVTGSGLKGDGKRSFGPIWMIAHLVKNLKFLQPKILSVAAEELEKYNWSRSAKLRVAGGHQPFLQVVLTCLRELEIEETKDRAAREDKEQVRDHLLQSLHGQLSTYLCFNQDEKLYNYEDPTARKMMQEALQLRFSLVGGMFDTITTSIQSITEWSTLMVQLVARGVIDLANNSDLYCTVLDMLTALIHSTLIIDREAGGSDRTEENKRHYLGLVKKLKKEIGDKQSPSIKYLRQLLPFPKQFEEVIVTEQFGLIPDTKGNKVRGFNCDKKQGLQVSEKQKISPWDLLEGHKNPAPLSLHWFQAVKHERVPMKYEEAFHQLKFCTNRTLQKPDSYYLDAPPLPPEDLQPSKDSKEEEKNGPSNGQIANGNRQGMMGQDVQAGMMGQNGRSVRGGAKNKRGQGQTRMMSPMNGSGMGGMPGGPAGIPGGPAGPGSYGGGQAGPGVGMPYGNYGGPGTGPTGMPGPQMGQGQPQMAYSQGQMGYGGAPTGVQGGMQPGPMQGIQGNRFGAPGLQGGPNSSKQALQNMLRARHPSPTGQYVAGPSQPPMGGMMRPGAPSQYGGMMPANQQGMGGMTRPMYNQQMGGSMGGSYGMQSGGVSQSYGGGYVGNNPQMRMNTPGQPMGGMRPGVPGQQYAMQGQMQGQMMSMQRQMPSGPGQGSYGMSPGASGPGRGPYGMQGGNVNMSMGSGAGGTRMMQPGMMQAGMQGSVELEGHG